MRRKALYSGYAYTGLLAAGLTAEQILDELPDLEPDDIPACLHYAVRKLDHPVIAA